MLPYAAAINCGELSPVPNCQPLRQTKLVLYAITPLLIAIAIAFCSVRIASNAAQMIKRFTIYRSDIGYFIRGIYLFISNSALTNRGTLQPVAAAPSTDMVFSVRALRVRYF